MDLVEMIYHEIKMFPDSELYGLTSQIRRSAVSIPANIAEGNGRSTRKDYLYFLSVANGSLMELETHLLIAQRVNILKAQSAEILLEQISKIGRLLTGLRRSLSTNKNE